MNEPVYRIGKKQNRQMIIWFLIALLIAVLPWFLLAQNQFDEKNTVVRDESAVKADDSVPTRHCKKVSPIQGC